MLKTKQTTIILVVLAITIALVISPTILNETYAKQTKVASKAEKTIKKKLDQLTGKNQEYDKLCKLLGQMIGKSEQSIVKKDCVIIPTNQPPVAKISSPDEAKAGDKVTVDGTGSSDSDGQIRSHKWSGQTFQNSTAPKTDFNMPNVTKTSFSLTVTDDKGATSIATKTILNSVQPIKCPTGQHLENGKCVPDPQPSKCSIGAPDKSKFVRIAVVADTDPAKSSQKSQFQQMKDCQADILILNGDICYSNCESKTFAMIEPLGFTKDNTEISCGNHDSCGAINSWLGATKGWSMSSYFNGKIDIVRIQESEGGGVCGSTQFNDVKTLISSSDAWYKFVTQHQPNHSAKSDHPETGDAKCMDQLFNDNGVDMLLQGHNHNYQRFVVGDVLGKEFIAIVGPPGFHDTGSNLYSINSNTDGKGNQCLKCIDNQNAVLYLDVQIDIPTAHKIIGKVVTLSGSVIDSFTN
jgi:predicted phosphodiesterase